MTDTSAVTAHDTRTLRFQEKRNAILSAATQQFNETGVKGATLVDIAGSVGLMTASVTYYYRKKEALAAACFLRAVDLFDEVARAAAKAPTVAERVRTLLRSHAEILAKVQRGEHWPVALFNDLRALPSPHIDEVHKAYNVMYRHVRALLKSEETATWGRQTLNARAHMLASLVHWMPRWIDRYEVQEYTRMADRVADITLNGMHSAQTVWPNELDTMPLHLPATGSGADAFLRAATVLVNEQGYRGASVKKISARLHMTKGAFYHHHDNKLDFISACFDRSFAVIRNALDAADAQGGSGWDRALMATCALMRFQLSDEGPLLRMSSTSALPAPEDRNRVYQAMQRLTERVGSVFVDGLIDGSVRPLDPTIAAQVVVCLLNAAAELYRWVPSISEHSVVGLYVRPVFLGLLSPEQSD